MSDLICPFNGCSYTTRSDDEYVEHTKTHKPNVFGRSPHYDLNKLWKIRLQIAREYANNGSKKPRDFAGKVWINKPENMDCGTWTIFIQDHGITDNDNFIGLDIAVDDEKQKSIEGRGISEI